jgi:hypothetical protein
LGGAGAGEWERLNEVLRIGLKKAAPPLPPHVGRSFFLSPEPLTPIDNNPPDESSIRHGGGQDIDRAPKGDPTHHHTKERVRTQRTTTHPNPIPTSQKNRRPLKELYQMPPDPTGDHSDATCGQITRHKPTGSPVAVRLAQALCRPTARRLTHGAPPSPASKSTTASTLSPAPITERWT